MRSTTRQLLAASVALAMITAACSSSDDYANETLTTLAQTRALVGPTEGFNSIGGTDTVNDQPYDLVFFDNSGVNPRIDTIDDALSTFAIDVDTGSYTIGRRWLADGNLPDKDSVRVEEYVNFFDYRYPVPGDGEAFAIDLEGGPTPFTENDRYQLLRIGI